MEGIWPQPDHPEFGFADLDPLRGKCCKAVPAAGADVALICCPCVQTQATLVPMAPLRTRLALGPVLRAPIEPALPPGTEACQPLLEGG